MLSRFRRIYSEFGTSAFIRTALLLIAFVVMALADFFAFSSIRAALIAMIGLVSGFLFKAKIAEGIEYYHRLRPVSLSIYSLILFLSKQLDFEGSVQLAIITAVTVLFFNLQFWSLSDLSAVNTQRRFQQ